MFQFDVLDITNNIEITETSKKILYPISQEIRADNFCDHGNSSEKVTFPNLCGMKVRNANHKYPINSLGFMSYEQNSVRGNTESVYLQSSVGHRNRGIYVNEKNIFDLVSLFTAKRLIHGNWIDWYDEYRKPIFETDLYGQFCADSLIYSLFNVKSYQSSLRQIEYKNQLWNIRNDFFWMSVEHMKQLADSKCYDELYNDVRTSQDCHVYKLLFGQQAVYEKLSPDAVVILNKATELVERSMEMRQVMANEENHLDSWDAGYAQLKLVWKEYLPEEFKAFRQLYKNLEDRMRPLVYELGFLMK